MSHLCECGCGQPTTPAARFSLGHHVTSNFLRAGKTARLTHGGAWTVEYFAYGGAKQRCTNPNNKKYQAYGGRGIKFLFTSFESFIAAVGLRPSPQHSLDRIENNGNYEPGNVKWSTRWEQNLNRRRPRRGNSH